MELQDIRNRIAEYDSQSASFTHAELETLCSRIISDLPRTAGNTRELMWAYEMVINRRIGEGRPARVMCVFKQ